MSCSWRSSCRVDAWESKNEPEAQLYLFAEKSFIRDHLICGFERTYEELSPRLQTDFYRGLLLLTKGIISAQGDYFQA